MRKLAIPLSALLLAACGLQPMYAGGSKAALAQGLSSVEVSQIPGREGWLLRKALNDRLAFAGARTPRYRLDVWLDDKLDSLAVLNDDTISRERRTLRARYHLVDLSTGEILLDATSGSDAGIDVVSSEYATIAAEQSALENLALDLSDRMVRRVAMTLRKSR